MANKDFVETVSYSSNAFADSVVEEQFGQGTWLDLTDDQKTRYLKSATQLINTLPFVGYKSIYTQVNEFPRGGDADTPYDVSVATVLVGVAMSDGDSITPGSNIIKEKIGDAEWAYGEEANYGISFISQEALRLLSPWINDPRAVRIFRTG